MHTEVFDFCQNRAGGYQGLNSRSLQNNELKLFEVFAIQTNDFTLCRVKTTSYYDTRSIVRS